MKKNEEVKEVKSKKNASPAPANEKPSKKSLALPENQRIQTAEGWKRKQQTAKP